MEIHTLEADLSDGLALQALLQVLSNKTISGTARGARAERRRLISRSSLGVVHL